ncbi:MAG: CRISPR-associated protein Cas5 [Acidobacteria bacterium]|nr:CRISPR-associated protein Cas5 [Acidobacteriota bacterium]
METFWLKIQAPFAAFRGFQAGVYRSTAPVIPPSTAYGLVLNLAGIEMRDYSNPKTTEIKKDLPNMQLAIGVCYEPERNSLYQQLHSYPVGNSGKELAELTKGAKFWIVPVRRELLVDYKGVIGIQTDDQTLRGKIEDGLCGKGNREYGLPFAGDNSFLFDKIEVADEQPEGVIWYVRHQPDDKQVKGSCRLYIGIDRIDNSKTTSAIFVPKNEFSKFAWTWTPKKPENL